MGSPRVLSILLLSCFLLLLFSHGFGVEVMGTVEHAAAGSVSEEKAESSVGKTRKMMMAMGVVKVADDYKEPGPNEPGSVQVADDYKEPGPNEPGSVQVQHQKP